MLNPGPSLAPLLLLIAWQGLFNPDVIWVLIPLTALAIPIVAIMVRPMMLRMQQGEREQARRMYERIVMEKLDVIKTAVAMGHGQNELAELDVRLEKLIGADRLVDLLDETPPQVPEVSAESELRDTDLERELQRLQQQREGTEREP